MSSICALFTHYNSLANTKECLQRLAAQTRQADDIIIVNNAEATELSKIEQVWAAISSSSRLHILPTTHNLGNAGGCALGMNHAFKQLHTNYLWILDDDSWPRPESLASLLEQKAAESCIRMSIVIDPQRGGELSWPLSAKAATEKTWRHISSIQELPPGNSIPSRGGWLGALYPKAAWEQLGTPTPELFIRGEDEEYPWKLRQAGYSFITLRNSILEHPSPKKPLLEYQLGRHSFFYETGLAESRSYYKNRNWAWLQRQGYPRKRQLIRRQLGCILYALLSLHAMIRSKEMSKQKITSLLRALYYGNKGQLRPYQNPPT